MKIALLPLCVAAHFFTSGCMSTRPGTVSYPSAGQGALLLAGATGGAAAGNAIDNNKGAPIGAAVGLGAGILTAKALSNREHEIADVAREAGRREGRMEVLRQINSTRETASISSRDRAADIIRYEPGVVEGIHYTPRDAAEAGLVEPKR